VGATGPSPSVDAVGPAFPGRSGQRPRLPRARRLTRRLPRTRRTLPLTPPSTPPPKHKTKTKIAPQEFPTLVLKVDGYTYPDGRTVQLLVADGTLPVYYVGVKYNIPVTLWVGEGYPASAPTLYVTPTPAMVVKPGHALVDGSGLVATPYLAAWGGR